MPESRYSTYTGQAPQYREPKYDRGRLRALTQEQLAPTISRLGRQMQGVQTATYANPMQRKQAIRGAIRGYGEALAPAQAQATRTAQGLYAPEYQAQLQGTQTRYQQELRDYQEQQDMERQRNLEGLQQEPPPMTTSRFMGRTWTRPGTHSVSGIGAASRRPAGTSLTGSGGIFNVRGGGTSGVAPATNYPQDWRTVGR